MSTTLDAPTPIANSDRNGTAADHSTPDDEFNPVLLALMRKAEADVERLRGELESVNAEEAKERELKAKAEDAFRSKTDDWMKLQLTAPTDDQFEALKRKRERLTNELRKAEAKLELELETIRKFELSQSATKGGWLARSKRNMAEFLEAANRILPEYSEKLARIVKETLAIWEQRDQRAGLSPEAVIAKLDPITKTALTRLAYELQGLYHTIKPWIDKSSAAVEEGRLTDVQRMELSLHLNELEIKYQTATLILGQLTPK